jgi:hypothetical protein
MNQQIRNYYAKHFGVFTPLSVNAIEQNCSYELSLQQLPSVIYGTYKVPVIHTNPHLALQDQLQQILRFHIN